MNSPSSCSTHIVAHQTAQDRLLNDLTRELKALEDGGLRRQLTAVESVDGPVVRIQGREVVSWCSNDYLGLSHHPALADAAARAAAGWGVGAGASRLLAGTTAWHRRLEEALAAWFRTEAAVVFPSGYLTNLGALGALLSRGDVAVIDRLAHASLVDAARASRATLRVFRHNDPEHAAWILARTSQARRRLLITEGVFSMEGDRAPLGALLTVAERYDAVLYLDDAHGAFVIGAGGRGSPEAARIAHSHFLYMATLGKALGCQGGFLVGPRALIEFLWNRAKTFIYTTALAIPVAAAAVSALELLGCEPQRRATLERLTERLRAGLARVLPSSPDAASSITPVVVGSSARALALSRSLWDQGLWAPAIRPPTVPDGRARVRLSVTALHTDAHIASLMEALYAGLSGLQAA